MFAATNGLGRRDGLLAASLAVALCVAGTSRMDVGVCGICHDDAIYVLTAKSLAEGHG